MNDKYPAYELTIWDIIQDTIFTEGEFDYNSRESPKTNWNLYDYDYDYDYAQIKEFAGYSDMLYCQNNLIFRNSILL